MWTGIRLRFGFVELIMSLRLLMLDTITLVLEEELAVSPIVYAAEPSPRARSGKFLIPVNLTLVLERSKRQIPSLESTTPKTNHGGRIGERIEVHSCAMYVMGYGIVRCHL
jgi:hypothetical protein